MRHIVSASPPVRAGRPEDEAKTDRIKLEAQKLIFAHGLGAVSMEQIASAADVSKSTVYAKFGSKVGVLYAVADDIFSNIAAAMERHTTQGDAPREALNEFGIAVLERVLQRRFLSAEPVIALQSQTDPSLGRKFFAAGPGRAKRQLARSCKAWQNQGQLCEGVADDMAETLMGLWLGTFVFEMRLKPDVDVTSDMIQARVARGVDQFLELYGPR